MKKISVLIFGLLISNLVSSQNYYPLVQDNNEWNVLRVSLGIYWSDTTCMTETYKIAGDTILNGQMYKMMFKSSEEFPVNWNYSGCIREEDQKVWYIGTNNYPESLIYDFNLSVGDSILWIDDPMIVDSIEYKLINNENRKHIYFSYLYDPSVIEFWVEGIGSNRGILTPGSATFEGGWYWLLCKKEYGDLIYMNPSFNSCYLIITGIEKNNSLIEIYPNPALDKIIIKNTGSLKFESVSLIDLKGQKLKKFEKNKTELSLSGISSGIYLLKLTHKNGETIRKIIIK